MANQRFIFHRRYYLRISTGEYFTQWTVGASSGLFMKRLILYLNVRNTRCRYSPKTACLTSIIHIGLYPKSTRVLFNRIVKNVCTKSISTSYLHFQNSMYILSLKALNFSILKVHSSRESTRRWKMLSGISLSDAWLIEDSSPLYMYLIYDIYTSTSPRMSLFSHCISSANIHKVVCTYILYKNSSKNENRKDTPGCLHVYIIIVNFECSLFYMLMHEDEQKN